jgi:DHA1 family bicyclomycin/chloramphenicol resistance-like MFS transporter
LGGAILLFAGWRTEFGLLAGLGVVCLGIAFLTLRESIPAQRASVVGPKLWLELLTDRRYIRYAASANLMQSGVFAYIAGAPFVYIDHFKLSPQQFAWLFGANAVGLLIVGRINAHIVSRFGPELIFRRAMRCTAVVGVLLFAANLLGIGGFWGLAIPQLLFIALLGFNFSNGFALALTHFGSCAGTASALFGTLQFVFAGLAGTAVSALYDGTPHAMAGVMCLTGVGAVALYRWTR